MIVMSKILASGMSSHKLESGMIQLLAGSLETLKSNEDLDLNSVTWEAKKTLDPFAWWKTAQTTTKANLETLELKTLTTPQPKRTWTAAE